MRRMSWLSGLLRGGSDEVGWDDLVRRIVEAVARLAHHGPRGEIAFPPDVLVEITVAGPGLDVVRGFVDQAALDREVEAALANRCDCAPADLPERSYAVAAGEATTVVAREGAPRRWEMLVEGGDLAGRALPLPAHFTELRLGRGEWHGADQHLRNDLVVCHHTEYVSRRAGRLLRTGNQIEVEALDQVDGLVVQRAQGEAVRPVRTARGRVALRDGDVIELGDGRGRAVRLLLRRT